MCSTGLIILKLRYAKKIIELIMMFFMFLVQLFHPKKPFINRLIDCKLNDRLVDRFLQEVSFELVQDSPEELVHQAGLKLAQYGTPNACMLAIHISNYSDTNYPESTVEVFRNAACEFGPVKGSDLSRTIEIIRGKFLHSEN
jgi:hypothetical protein